MTNLNSSSEAKSSSIPFVLWSNRIIMNTNLISWTEANGRRGREKIEEAQASQLLCSARVCAVTRWNTHCNALQHTATHCSALQHTATHCSTLQRTATHHDAPWRTATYWNALQRIATHWNTLQHTATQDSVAVCEATAIAYKLFFCKWPTKKSHLIDPLLLSGEDSSIALSNRSFHALGH